MEALGGGEVEVGEGGGGPGPSRVSSKGGA